MGLFDVLKSIGKAVVEKPQEEQYHQMKRASDQHRSQHGSEPKLGGKTLREWEGSWRHLGTLAGASISHLSHSVGLYRASKSGKVVYIGRAVEYNNGGLRKRLSDYTRKSNSSRKHGSGQLMNTHASELTIDVLITGDDAQAADVAKKLEAYFVDKEVKAKGSSLQNCKKVIQIPDGT